MRGGAWGGPSGASHAHFQPETGEMRAKITANFVSCKLMWKHVRTARHVPAYWQGTVSCCVSQCLVKARHLLLDGILTEDATEDEEMTGQKRQLEHDEFRVLAYKAEVVRPALIKSLLLVILWLLAATYNNRLITNKTLIVTILDLLAF